LPSQPKPEEQQSREDWVLSAANPNRALARAMRGLPSEDFKSPRGGNLVDAVRYFEPAEWESFVSFYPETEAKNRELERTRSRERVSLFGGWTIFRAALGRIAERVRSSEIVCTAIPIDEAFPVSIPGDSLALALLALTGFDQISKSEIAIHGHRFIDVRFQLADKTVVTHTGRRGRPTSKHIYVAEANARARQGLLSPMIGSEAKHLAGWMRRSHPNAPPPKAETIENNLRPEWNRLQRINTRALAESGTGHPRK
jgi:hypothetical protein